MTVALEKQREQQRQSSARYRAAHPDKVKADLKAWRLRNRAHLKEYDRKKDLARTATNPEEGLTKIEAWKAANPERLKAAQRAYYRANQEKVKKRAKDWAAANPDRVRSNGKAWKKANPDKARASGRRAAARRRARKCGARVVESIDLVTLGNRDKWVCGICNKKVNKRLRWPHKLSASHDHIIPLIKGGDHSWANAQLAHLTCNRKKWGSLHV